ncbi:MAG TPA: MBL fold metallo-hydrolase, partial [Solirubrobacteraceae bacterium]
MPETNTKRELGRGERVMSGVYRLRLPLPWPGVPHCNAWAVRAGDGVVLFDTGMHQPGSIAHLERALQMCHLRIEDIRLVVCTHA